MLKHSESYGAHSMLKNKGTAHSRNQWRYGDTCEFKESGLMSGTGGSILGLVGLMDLLSCVLASLHKGAVGDHNT